MGVNSRCKADFFFSLASLKVCVLGSLPEDIYVLRKELESFSWFFISSQFEAVIDGSLLDIVSQTDNRANEYCHQKRDQVLQIKFELRRLPQIA